MISKSYSVAALRRSLKECCRPRHLLRTSVIALLVGTWLTLFNQADVLWTDPVNAVVLVKVLLNYLTPFVVANLGLLSSERSSEPGGETLSGGTHSGENSC